MNQSTIEGIAESQFDGFAPTYDQLLQDPLRTGFASDPLYFCRRKWWILNGLLRKLGQRAESMSWLDVGCGRGELLKLAGSNFAYASGCDPSAFMLSCGPSLQLHRQPSPCELPFPSESFDLITAVCVYHHVRTHDRRALTGEVLRVLRPGGLFCLIEHNPWNPMTRRIVNRCPVDADAELLTLPAAAALLTASGLYPQIWEYFLYLPERWFQRFSRFESVLGRVPFGGQYILIARAGPILR